MCFSRTNSTEFVSTSVRDSSPHYFAFSLAGLHESTNVPQSRFPPQDLKEFLISFQMVPFSALLQIFRSAFPGWYFTKLDSAEIGDSWPIHFSFFFVDFPGPEMCQPRLPSESETILNGFLKDSSLSLALNFHTFNLLVGFFPILPCVGWKLLAMSFLILLAHPRVFSDVLHPSVCPVSES